MYQKKIDLLNVVLILASLYLAFVIPFELFLFSYAVLGPLHYLTEINWLNKKSYFIQNQRWIWFFVSLAFLISIPLLLSSSYLHNLEDYSLVSAIQGFCKKYNDNLTLLALLLAIGAVQFHQKKSILIFLLISLIISAGMLFLFPISLMVISLFIPTLIHVYLFTLFFMIYGCIHNTNTFGILSIVLLAISPFLILFANIEPSHFSISQETIDRFKGSNFQQLNGSIAKLTDTLVNGNFYMLSVSGIKIQIFIAFCYTYHYLNWFSKTNIIGWARNVSRFKLLGIVAVWILSIMLYSLDYRTGYTFLFILSLSHVFLEFPLNIVSIKSILSNISLSKSSMK